MKPIDPDQLAAITGGQGSLLQRLWSGLGAELGSPIAAYGFDRKAYAHVDWRTFQDTHQAFRTLFYQHVPSFWPHWWAGDSTGW